MKRILMLIPALNAGGAERVMTTLANEWSMSNEVTIVVFNNGNSFYKLNDRVLIEPLNIMPEKKGVKRFFSIPIVEAKRFFKIYNKIKKERYDFVLAFCYTANFFASICSLLLKKSVIIVSERNDPSEYTKGIRCLINCLYKYNYAVICQNEVAKMYFKENNFKNRLLILPNPVNFNAIPKNRPAHFRKEIVTVGRLIPQKNQSLLIEAFSEIEKEFPDYILKIYGIGPLEMQLKKLIHDLHLEKKVFLMGTVEKIMFEINECAFFVLPSNFEGFPNVLIEAMATGLPVISSDFRTGIAKKLIKNGENGYLFKAGDKKGLILALRTMIEREKDFEEIGEKNRIVAQQYKAEDISRKWMEEIEGN